MVKNQTGLQDGTFFPCPDSPNCVSSMTEGTDHYIDPIAYAEMTREEAVQLMTRVVEYEVNSFITYAEDYYIHACIPLEFFSIGQQGSDRISLLLPAHTNPVAAY